MKCGEGNISSPKLSPLKSFSISLPLQPFYGHHIRFHIFQHSWAPHTFFTVGLDY